MLSLEDIALKTGTDKGRDDHGYVQLYGMLFDHMRNQALNVTEVGISTGMSIRMWHEYFPNAHIYGMDTWKSSQASKLEVELGERAHMFFHVNSMDPRILDELSLRPESMDIVIDDGDHVPLSNAHTLVNLWPLVKPGGTYIIEDVATGSNSYGHYMNRAKMPWHRSGFSLLAHNNSFEGRLQSVRQIYEANDVFLADTLVGNRDWNHYLKRHEGAWIRDRVNHNSHAIVIRKRRNGPRTSSPFRPLRISNWPGRTPRSQMNDAPSPM
jgi:hypothetical protein